MRSALVGILLVTSSIGCGSSSSSGLPDGGGARPDAAMPDAGNADGGTITGPELITCPSGSTLVNYSLTPITPVPSLGQLELTGLPNGSQVLSAGTGTSYSVRLDLCRNAAGEHSLAGVLWTMEDFGAPSYLVRDETISAATMDFVEYRGGTVFLVRFPPSAVVVNGLAEALGGNLDPLEVRFIGDNGLIMFGHAGFVAGTLATVGASSIMYTNIFVIAGGLAAGDVFSTRPCPFGENIMSKSWQMSTATFSVVACSFLGGGHTMGYRITHLEVTDTNNELTAAERETFTFDGESTVNAVMNYRWNHHNACDSFHLALPHADYAATAAPIAGCGEQVPNAPMRSFEDDPSEPVKFRIRYHGGNWVDGEMSGGCTHYLMCR